MVMYKTTANGDVEMSPEEEAQVLETQADAAAQKTIRNIADLWASADRYIYQYINGVGLSILAAGVNAGHPKAIAVAAWSDAVWAGYYAKKNDLLSGKPLDLDFSGFGAIPYDVLELRAEIESLWGK